jgi:hypothetical protein
VNSPALGGKKMAKVQTVTAAPSESEMRADWPAGDRGKVSGGSYIGGVTKEEDKKDVLKNEKKLAAHTQRSASRECARDSTCKWEARIGHI